eukprot:1912288-Pyramimonas_sp.AAC.1
MSELCHVVESLFTRLAWYVDSGAITPPAGGFDEPKIREILRDIVRGLDYLHYNKTVCRLAESNGFRSSTEPLIVRFIVEGFIGVNMRNNGLFHE